MLAARAALLLALSSCGSSDPVVGGSNPNSSPVVLGRVGNQVILAKSGVDAVPLSVITGKLGLSPAARVSATRRVRTTSSAAARREAERQGEA